MQFIIAGELLGTPGRSAGVMWTIRMSQQRRAARICLGQMLSYV